MTGSAHYGSVWLSFDVVQSTNDTARAWALAGLPAGALITASAQTKGRGRRGARWHDTPGESAIMTFIGQDRYSLDSIWRLPFAASLAVLRAVRTLGAPNAMLKWPNDVVCQGGKLGGVLVETLSRPEGCIVPLIGIGVNVAQARFENVSEYAMPATSLVQISNNQACSPIRIIEAICQEMSYADRLMESWDSWAELMDEWRGAMVTGGVQKGVTQAGKAAEGVIRTVRNEDGAALIETKGGGITAIWPSIA